MQKYQESASQDKKRQRREWIVILCLILVILPLYYVGMRYFDLGLDLPGSNSTLIFFLININVIILLGLLYLTVRNLVKLLFERKKSIMGARLRSKLVLAFILLSLMPTIILFFVSAQFISSSIEYWYNIPIERSLRNSIDLGQDYYEKTYHKIFTFGNNISRIITYDGLTPLAKNSDLVKFVNDKLKQYNFSRIRVYSQKLELRVSVQDTNHDMEIFTGPEQQDLEACFNTADEIRLRESSDYGDLAGGIIPIFSRTENRAVVGLIVIDEHIPAKFANKLKSVSSGLDEYQQSKMLKRPVKAIHMILLSIVTLLIIFISVWFGFYLSKGITVPIQELAEGTERIASGDYNFFIDLEAADEIGVLVNSFNRMTLDLKNSKRQIEKANEELIKSNMELEQRRRYMEIVLTNVGAGVISADAEGRLLTVNKSAEKMLGIKVADVVGKNYREVMSPEQVRVINDFLADRAFKKRGYIQNQIRITTADSKSLALIVYLNMLRDEHGRYSGLVAVFDDFSEIEKAQREAAWRQVARRIAHEVKNPLTPIQLSAQRIKKRLESKVDKDDAQMLDECTDMIIKEAEVLKRLVNEFSSYARMPAINPAPSDLNSVVTEAVSLYQVTQNNVKVSFGGSAPVPVFSFDNEQIKRVMINLLDNAITAAGPEGEVNVRLSYDKELDLARIEISDNGNGVQDDDKKRIFEPYFSTKNHGTGLGLAIVNQIVKDHRGFVDVIDNIPKGTRFIVELPLSL
ncbi:MAG: PAS domain S-box protein [Deltaproteobacteria bacterium]|nr:PAS domain S-box protein [Deltaproteobacteria bacterium]